MESTGKGLKKRRVIAFLNRDQIEFLDRLGMDSLFSTGSKLSRIDVLSAFVDAMMTLHVSADGVKRRDQLVGKILGKAADREKEEKNPAV